MTKKMGITKLNLLGNEELPFGQESVIATNLDIVNSICKE